MNRALYIAVYGAPYCSWHLSGAQMLACLRLIMSFEFHTCSIITIRLENPFKELTQELYRRSVCPLYKLDRSSIGALYELYRILSEVYRSSIGPLKAMYRARPRDALDPSELLILLVSGALCTRPVETCLNLIVFGNQASFKGNTQAPINGIMHFYDPPKSFQNLLF